MLAIIVGSSVSISAAPHGTTWHPALVGLRLRHIKWDEAGKCNEQQAQKLRVWKREWNICDLKAVVEAKHSIGQLLIHPAKRMSNRQPMSIPQIATVHWDVMRICFLRVVHGEALENPSQPRTVTNIIVCQFSWGTHGFPWLPIASHCAWIGLAEGHPDL